MENIRQRDDILYLFSILKMAMTNVVSSVRPNFWLILSKAEDVQKVQFLGNGSGSFFYLNFF